MTSQAGARGSAVIVRALQPPDWGRVRGIYAAGIATGVATFESAVPPADELDSKWIIGQRWVAVDPTGQILGWAALTPTSSRRCYRGVVETSVYVAPEAAGRGVGRALVQHQVDAAFAAGFWTLQASIFAMNRASLVLHLSVGFREVGRRERIAQRDGIWHNTVIVELRSSLV